MKKNKRYVLGKKSDDITHLFAGGIAGLVAVMLFFVWLSEHIGG